MESGVNIKIAHGYFPKYKWPSHTGLLDRLSGVPGMFPALSDKDLKVPRKLTKPGWTLVSFSCPRLKTGFIP